MASASVRLTSVDVHPRYHEGRGLTLREDEVSASLALVGPRRPPCLRVGPPRAGGGQDNVAVVRQGPARPESGDSSHHRCPCPCPCSVVGSHGMDGVGRVDDAAQLGGLGRPGWTRLPAPAGGGCSLLCVHGAAALRLPVSPLQKDEPQHLPVGSSSQLVNIRQVKSHSHPGTKTPRKFQVNFLP